MSSSSPPHELIQNSNFDLNVTDDAGMTALMWAAYHNNLPIATFLLHEGADREEKDIDGYTAMHWYVQPGLSLSFPPHLLSVLPNVVE